ncbi:hypothetical protein MLD38_014638 [Melastoma candidum]|uniref:Uncharacterized protein n=1 Tax=Melastoma candidum TaxID=119954 RepID=A0ACB9RES1_9MYRT|nr:hypothetical protein MLD38_014638 [Melastoma candidum]
MVGGIGNRRDDGSLVIKNTNVFAALETLRKKKKSDKDKSSKSKSAKSLSSSSVRGKGDQPLQQQVFWAPAPLKAKSWADVDDDEDDDYYATTAPPSSVWGKTAAQQEEDQGHEMNDNNVEDTESEEDLLDEGDEELEEEHENESAIIQPEPTVKKSTEPADVTVTTKDADRQLSKKERKKKELAELEALLADFGVAPKESNDQEESGVLQIKKDGELDGEGEKKDNAPGESKAVKKKKKKEKSSKEAKDAQDHPNNSDTQNVTEETAGAEQAGEDGSSVDMKERLKKMASTKKKKSGKEVDAAARAAAQEAAARSAKLAAREEEGEEPL